VRVCIYTYARVYVCVRVVYHIYIYMYTYIHDTQARDLHDAVPGRKEETCGNRAEIATQALITTVTTTGSRPIRFI